MTAQDPGAPDPAPSPAPQPWRLFRHDRLGSTNDLCIARAEAGEPAWLAVQARQQTSPRGSRGRSWSEVPGTLALSVLLRPQAGPAPSWPVLAGLAFHDALALTPHHADALRLKWPNDVLLAGCKLGGILIETAPPAGESEGWVVIGFGANLERAPELADRRAACLAELGQAPTADALADRLLKALLRRYDDQSHPGLLRRDWLERAHPVGTKLVVRGRDGQVEGSFASIEEDGTLLLDVAGEIRRFATGEVLLPQGA